MVKLSPQEINELQEIFNLVDVDGSGEIDIQASTSSKIRSICPTLITELNMLVNTLGVYPSQEELQEIILQVDTDRSGSISFEEFIQCFVQDIKPTYSKNELISAFKMFQESNDVKGTIRRHELERVLMVYAECARDEAISMTEMADTEQDGLIRFEDLVDRMM